jgi:hypothetical protein
MVMHEKNSKLFDRVLRLTDIRWQRVQTLRYLGGWFLNKILLVVLDGLTKETCIAAFLFGKRVIELKKKGGLLFVALYCKQCASSLQIAYGGVVPQRGLLPVPVSLTRSGYPAFHRQMIRRHDSKADQLVRVYLSFFSISKIIRLAKRVSDSTFCSIVEPWTNTNLVLQTVSGVK